MNFDGLEQYYLLRCYPKEEYRTNFNTGSKIYINSSSYFHNLENEFQQDDEGVVFRQLPHTTGSLYATNEDMLQILLDKGLFQFQDGGIVISPSAHIDDVKRVFENHSEVLFSTENAVFSIPFYLCCFYLIPKTDLTITKQCLHFKNEHVLNSFYTFMNRYAQEKNGYAFASIYDAKLLVSNLYQILRSKGYFVAYGPVQYKNFTEEERINNYKTGNTDALLLTKPTKFSYQHEFRIIIKPEHNLVSDHMEEKGQDLTEAVRMDFAYLTPDYVKRMKHHEV